MILQGSKREEIYNEFWDRAIVPLYNKLAGKTPIPAFFTQQKEGEMIQQFYLNVKSLITTFVRQREDYEDTEYCDQYLRDTINTAVIDLSGFKQLVKSARHEAAIDDFIAELLLFASAHLKSSVTHHREQQMAP